MTCKVIYDDEEIIGYSEDIVSDFLENGDNDDELINDLINRLNELDHELVYIDYHPMGAYSVYRLNKERLFIV